MRRSLVIHSSISVLFLKPVICTCSTPGYSAIIFQSSSAIRTGLKLTFGLAIRCYADNSTKNQMVCGLSARRIGAHLRFLKVPLRSSALASNPMVISCLQEYELEADFDENASACFNA